MATTDKEWGSDNMNKYGKLEGINNQNFTEMQPNMKDKSIDK